MMRVRGLVGRWRELGSRGGDFWLTGVGREGRERGIMALSRLTLFRMYLFAALLRNPLLNYPLIE